ncbi:MAG: hypothetical protein M1459_00780 [Patescibacteria group bacterium]|nr:hypothetical protein [Patescibacteria group bacterium]
MKKIFTIPATVLAIAIIFMATTNIGKAQTLMDTSAATSIGASLDASAPVPAVNTIKDRLRATIQTREENAGDNAELRNRLLEQRAVGASTSQKLQPLGAAIRASTTEERANIRERRIEGVENAREDATREAEGASSTAQRREILRNARMDVFRIRQQALVKQLNLSISNLEQIAGRIGDRIEKAEAAGRNMTEAKGLLAQAVTDISAAKDTIDAVANYVPPAPTASTTAQVDLAKPREIGAGAIAAVTKARKDLVATVEAIAHAMGIKLGNTASGSTTPATNE